MSEVLLLNVIKANNGYFINFPDKSNYYTSKLFLNSEPLKPSFKKDWFVCNNIPERIHYLNKVVDKARFELRREFSKMKDTGLPEILTLEECLSDPTQVCDDDDKYDFNEEYYKYRNLYEYKYEYKYELIDMNFKTTIILTIDKNLGETEISFPITNGKPENFITSSHVKHYLVHELLYPNIVNEYLPCKLDAQESYEIIRTHILHNINPKVARVTHNYDFCFTVKKDIKLHTDVMERVEIKTATGKSYKNKKYREHFVTHRSITVFEMAPKPYQNYPVITPFEGMSYKDLRDNIEKYLSELMENINAPLIDCPHCKGMGVILND